MTPRPHLVVLAVTLFLASPIAAGEIHDLLEKGEVEKAKALLAKDPSLVSSRDESKHTPLHYAATYGLPEIAELLLKLGAEVDARGSNQCTPLHLTSSPAVVKLLVAHKADLNATSAVGTALQQAANMSQHSDGEKARHLREIMKLLIDAGARYDMLSATYLGDVDRVAALIKANPKEAQNPDAMREAARAGRTAIVKLLLDNKADPDDANFFGPPVLYFALEHPDVVRLLIKAGADVKSPLKDKRTGVVTGPMPSGTLLHHAAAKNQPETARLLIEAGANPNAREGRGVSPLFDAARGGSPEVLKLLLKHKVSTRGDIGTMAMAAAAERVYYAEQEAKLVERYKAVITTLGGEGVPIDLRAALTLGDLERVKELAMDKSVFAPPVRGPRVKAPEPENPPLAIAVGLNHKDIVVALLDAGAPIEGKDKAGYTALLNAAFWGREEIAKLLIERRANVNARANRAQTPLHVAAEYGRVGVAKLLLAAGADVNAEDIDRKTPLASIGKHKDKAAELRELFKKHGGR